jgi:phospholysine phosphohistidine inorganic pyrophosphate phosphatase
MRGILFDLDGVIYNSETVIEGAAETIAWVQNKNIPHLFVTNTSSRSRNVLLEKLHCFGIHTELDSILTPCNAAAEWLRTRSDGMTALFVSPKSRAEFAGIPCLDDAAETGARYVVIGDLGDGWTFRTLNRAFRLLHSQPDSVIIALGMTRFWFAEDGVRLDTAPFVTALEHATGKKAQVFGKPSQSFFLAAMNRLALPASEIVMVGDDIVTDIAGAQQTGLHTVLVRTGKFRPSDLEGTVAPDGVLNSVRDLPSWWANR